MTEQQSQLRAASKQSSEQGVEGKQRVQPSQNPQIDEEVGRMIEKMSIKSIEETKKRKTRKEKKHINKRRK